ncbi:hypothetical protein BAE44_0017838 [Dichanthelium oligosanthes]|uniref:Uncharacterized protein n=1 Tax=Dichanthelium oligosanthes TaxID=888268 RepID=A0A1E5V7M0_9POAL|nr:hypothetical protein BAE44_0017838 [Dichanthelium oligosanthes]
MGCGTSKEAVVKGNSGTSRCNRFRKKSSVVVDATQPSRGPLPSDDGSAVFAKANDEVIADTKDKATTSTQKAIAEEKKEEGINNKADQVVKDKKEAFAVKEGNVASPANAIPDKKEDESKKDEVINRDAKEVITIKGKEVLTEKATKDKEQEEDKKDVLKDKMVANQKANVASTESAIAEGKEDVVEIPMEGDVKDKKNEGDNGEMAIKENDEAALTENDASSEDDDKENKEDDSVTFPVAMVTEEDGSVTFRVPDDAATKDDDSVTFPTALATKNSNIVAMVTEEDGSVTFAVPVAPVSKDDDSVTSAAAPETKDDGVVAMVTEEDGTVTVAKPVALVTKDGHSVTFVATPMTKDDDNVTLAAAPTTKDNGIVTLTAAQVEEEVAEQSEHSEDNKEVKNEAELPEPTVFEDEESTTEVDGTTDGEEEGVAEQSKPSEDNEVKKEAELPDPTVVEQVVAEQSKPSEDNEKVKNEAELPDPTVVDQVVSEQSKPSEDNEEVKNEAELPDPTVVEQVVTEVVEALKVEEEGRVDTVGEIKVEQDKKSVSKEPEDENSSAVLRDKDGKSDGKQLIDSKETITTEEKIEELAVPEKENDVEKAPAPSASALN